MNVWCSAAQRLPSAVRLAIPSISTRSAYVRPQFVSKDLHTRAPVICGAAPPARLKTRESTQSSKPAQVPKKAAQDSFYAPEAVTFTSLGTSPAVAEALEQASFYRPSTVQELALPVLAEGTSAVLAAETGSGKTICYLVPVISRLLELKQTQTGLHPNNREGKITPGALVLCPNAALCNQVKLVADSLTNREGSPLLATAHVSSSSPPPFSIPDILVCTPASLINVTQATHYGPEWTKGGVLARMHVIVLDEADLLLSGGFERDVGRILDNMKQNDKERQAHCLSHELGIPPEDFQGLPRHVKAAGFEGGVQAMLDVGYDRSPHKPEDDILQPSTSTLVPSDRQFQRQYIFVAATLPSEGKKSTATSLQKKFPDLVWLAGNRLHQGLSTVQWAWQQTSEDTWKTALQEAVTARKPPEGYPERVLVFAETVAAANGVANALEAVSIAVLRYHKAIPASERAASLTAMSKQGGVMVSTDAASRGIDIPNVTHVIQADFAASAVDFLHRVGRTARQGQFGQVTSLYSLERKPLAEAVKAAIEADMPVEGAFSRNRSFSKKIRKYGQYVPRGQAGPSP